MQEKMRINVLYVTQYRSNLRFSDKKTAIMYGRFTNIIYICTRYSTIQIRINE